VAGEPCGACASCERIWRGETSLDVVEIDAASNRGVDDARELRERAMYAPSGDDRYKVYIVDEAHMLTREAWNALLKILEEPPPRVVFVFATTEPQKIAQSAAPVLSRLQRFDLRRIGPADIRARLTQVLEGEGIQADPDALAMIARAADGSMRDALSLTDQVLSMSDGRLGMERVRDALGLVPEDEFLAVLDLVAERRAADVFPTVARLADAGLDFGAFLGGLSDIVRAQLAVTLGGAPADLSERLRESLVERRERLSAADLLRMLNAIAELEPRFRKSGQQQLLVETLLVRLALMDRTLELEEMLRSLGGGGSGGGEPRVPVARDPVRPSAPPARPTPAPEPPRAPAPQPDPAPPARPTRPATAERPPTASYAPPAPGAARVEGSPPDLNRIVERWDELLARLAAEKPTLGMAMQHVSPRSANGRGELVLELEEANDFYAQAFESGKGLVLGVLREWFPGLSRVALRIPEGGGPATPARRMTDEEIRRDRLEALRKKDPVLGAAIDALDLDVVD
jgi:DNA polymerase-3 subunit gamma/tau